MGVVGSTSLENKPASIIPKQEPIINEQFNDDTSISYKIISDKDSDNDTKTDSSAEISADSMSSNPKRYEVVSYGPINVRVCLDETLTLKTGRRSKFIELDGDADTKRERRRARNRASAKKLKEKRILLEIQLRKELEALETRENALKTEINNLQSYKQFLERRYREVILSREYFMRNHASYLMHLESFSPYSPESNDWRLTYDDCVTSRLD